MSRHHSFRPETLALHSGQAAPWPKAQSRPNTVPICFSSGFTFSDPDRAEALFNQELPGHIHSRISNPTCAAVEERIAVLEHGIGAIAAASGQAALHLAIATLMNTGGHIVAANTP